MRRLLFTIFLTLFGLGIGLAVGAILMRRVDRAKTKMTPENLTEQAAHAVADLRRRWRAALEEGSRAASETETQLRAKFGVPTVEEAAQRGSAARRDRRGT